MESVADGQSLAFPIRNLGHSLPQLRIGHIHQQPRPCSPPLKTMCPENQYSLHKDKERDRIPTERDAVSDTIPRAFRVGPLGLYDSATELQAKVSENTCMATFIKCLALTEARDLDPGIVHNLKVVVGIFEAAFRRFHGPQADRFREAASVSLLKTALEALEVRVPKEENETSQFRAVTGNRNMQETPQPSSEESAQSIPVTPAASGKAPETGANERRGAQSRAPDQTYLTQAPEYLALTVRLDECTSRVTLNGLGDPSQRRSIPTHILTAERGCALYLQTLIMYARIDIVKLMMQGAKFAPPRRHLDTAKTIESSYAELVESVSRAEEAMKTALRVHESQT